MRILTAPLATLRRILLRPTQTRGRRYSCHRVVLLIAVGVWLYLWRPAVPGEATEAKDRIVVTAAVAVAAVLLPRR